MRSPPTVCTQDNHPPPTDTAVDIDFSLFCVIFWVDSPIIQSKDPLTVPGGNVWIIPFDTLSHSVLMYSALCQYWSSLVMLVICLMFFSQKWQNITSKVPLRLYVWWLIRLCLLQLLLENLEHEDSFIYLSAIQGNTMEQLGQMWHSHWFLSLLIYSYGLLILTGSVFSNSWRQMDWVCTVCRTGYTGWFLPWKDLGEAPKRLPTWPLTAYVWQGPLPGDPP